MTDSGPPVGAVFCIIVVAILVGVLVWSVRKYGWPGTWRLLTALPARLWRTVQEFVQTPIGRRRARGLTLNVAIAQLQFQRLSEHAHKFTLQYPSTWSVTRTDSQTASLIVQLTCDSAEEAYKRVSVAWDDISWSNTTAEKFAKAIVQQLTTLVPGAELLSHGLYRPGARSDGAYEIVYAVTDSMDGSQMRLMNVVIVSTHGGRRRAYTITFGADAPAFADALPLAHQIIDSFVFDATATRETPSPSSVDEVHVNVWEREREKSRLLADSGPSKAAAAVSPVFCETVCDPAGVTWATGCITQAGFSYAYPSNWLCSGLGHDESAGFAPIAVHAVRRWCISHTCDRRESCFKHVSVVCIDLTPCYDIVASRLAKNPKALDGVDPGTLLVTYLGYRYRAELAELEAVSAARAPTLPPLGPGEEGLKHFMDLFGQRWPPSCRLSTPVSHANAAQVVAPTHATMLDVRNVGTSKLLKVGGWVRTGTATGSGASSVGSPEPNGMRRSSTYSSLSLDHDTASAEGLVIDVTSAVLLGIHDAHVSTGAGATGAAARGAPPILSKRVFGHIVTVSLAAPVFQSYEPLAKKIFRSLDASDSAAK